MKRKQLTKLITCGALGILLCGCDMSGRGEGQLYQANDTNQFANSANETETSESTEQKEDHKEQTSENKIVQKLGVGWNLGNALDAWDKKAEMGNVINDTESLFGNPVTTKEMIDMVRDQGFQTVRIPVTYYNHIKEDGSIDKNWLKRVKEVVNYVLDDGMNCVINMHHDTGVDGWIWADEKNYEENKDKVAQLWSQIAAYYEATGEQLIFEGFNEMLDTEQKWEYAGDESYEVMNKWNQLFVDTIRSAKGKNKKRYLMVNTYAASASEEVINHFELPEDTIENHLIVGVHCYKGKDELESVFHVLKSHFSDKTIPVVISEFALGHDQELTERGDYATYYHDNALKNGIAYFWWDDGNYSLESNSTQDVCNYALLNRVRLEWAYPELADELIQ